MNSKAFVLFFLLNVFQISASAEVEIFPLFSTEHWVAGLNVPLRIQGVPQLIASEVTTEVVSGTLTAKECKVMRDPFIRENFLVRCLKDGTLSIKFTIATSEEGQTKPKYTVLKYGPMTIKKLEGLKVPEEPGGGETSNPDVIAGQALYSAHCNGCHSAKDAFLSTHSSVTGDLIWSAINGGISGMAGLKSVLSRPQVDQINAYLNAR